MISKQRIWLSRILHTWRGYKNTCSVYSFPKNGT